MFCLGEDKFHTGRRVATAGINKKTACTLSYLNMDKLKIAAKNHYLKSSITHQKPQINL